MEEGQIKFQEQGGCHPPHIVLMVSTRLVLIRIVGEISVEPPKDV